MSTESRPAEEAYDVVRALGLPHFDAALEDDPHARAFVARDDAGRIDPRR